MQVVAEEAFESYDLDLILKLGSNSVKELEDNVGLVEKWIENWNLNLNQRNPVAGPISSCQDEIR